VERRRAFDAAGFRRLRFLRLGLPFSGVAALLLTIAALSGRIDAGQGLLFLFVYFFFFVKILELF